MEGFVWEISSGGNFEKIEKVEKVSLVVSLVVWFVL